jgi:arylsulfatase A-like enzyme
MRRVALMVMSAALVACGGTATTTTRQMPSAAPPPLPQVKAGPSALSQSRNGKPNLVMIMTDDQTVEDMIALPQTRELIGARGVNFGNSFASWPLCCPSRATAFTGQYAHNHMVLGNYPPAGSSEAFITDDESLAVWLQRAGYATTHIGKYLNGYGIDSRGMDYVPPGWNEWHGMVDPSTYQMWGYTINHNGRLQTYGRANVEDPALYQTDVLRSIAVDAIDRFADGTQPFFLSLAFLAPHEELGDVPKAGEQYPGPRPAPRHRNAFANVQLPRPANFDEANLYRKPRFVADFSRAFAGETMAERTGRYRRRLAALRAVDEAVAAIVARLAALQLLDNTYIVFTSDNGWFNGEHHIALGKYLFYEPSIRVPLLLRGPGIPAGHISDELVANVDLAPTLVDLAGARAGRPMDGRSLMPYARDATLRTRRPILLDAPHDQAIKVVNGTPQAVVPAMRGLRTPRFAYFEHGTGEVELYNMIEDPDQLRNVHEMPLYHHVEAAMHEALARYSNCAGPTCRADVLAPAQPPAAPGFNRAPPSPAPKARVR